MRRFEYNDDKSAKFWEIEQADSDLNIRWGRIGTAGQSQTKAFADAAKADAALLKLVKEKTGKGYAESATTAGAVIGAASVKEIKPAATVKKTAAAVVAAEVQPAPAAPAAPAETLDQQIDRAFESLRAQIAAGTLLPGSSLTATKIRRLCGISELAAGQVSKRLDSCGLLGYYSNDVCSQARKIAIELGAEETAGAADAGAAVAAAPEPDAPQDGSLPPWLAQGEQPHPLAGAELRRAARASRRFPKPVNAVDPQRAWLQLRPLISKGKSADFADTDADLREAFEAAWTSLDTPKLTGSSHTDAVLLALCLSNYSHTENDVGAQFVDYLVARHGLPYTVDALLQAQAITVQEDYVHGGKNTWRLSRTVSEPLMSSSNGALSEGEWCLRKHLAAAPQAEYDACVAAVRAALPHIAAQRQPALALLLPDVPELSHELIAAFCAAGVVTPPAVHWLQLTATDPAMLALARKVKSNSYTDFWGRADMVNTVLMERGADAVLWLAPGAAQDEAGEALARIGTPETLDALARVASSSKDALLRFNVAVARSPAAAMAALARLLGGNSKDAGLLTPTLTELLRTHAALPAQLRPWLEPAGNALVDMLLARLAGPAQLADAADLPEVLARPPWLQTAKKAVASLQLAPLPLPGVERWDAGEKEAALAINSWHVEHYASAARHPDVMAGSLGFSTKNRLSLGKQASAAIREGDLPGLLDAWRAMLADKKKERWYYFNFDAQAAAHLPAPLGIAFWNAIAGEVSCAGVQYVAAKWGMPALPGLLAKIGSAPSENLHIALNFGVVELAPVAARAFAKLKSLRGLGRQWLQRFPEHAACALIAPAVGKPSEARDCAASALRWLAANGHAALLDEVAGRYERADVPAALHAMLNESPLDRYPNKRAALPEFWRPDGWIRPVLPNGKALSDAALDALGTMMKFPTAEEVYAGLHQVKAACAPASLADFAWDCFSAWLNAGAPSKEAWAMSNLGLFGSDDTARKLTPYLRAWPGEAAHARAVAGLDVLAAIGTDVALMLLNGIAQKVKFKGLQDKAVEKIAAIAEARGLSAEELEDRLAPDLGLDEHGSMVLDFGPRAYKVGFDESLKPFVREWSNNQAGARLPDLPKPKKTDDEALSKEATERFKLLKKDARTIASQQVLRLELAMCTRRRWDAAVFAQFIANHPLVRHLVRRLVWGVYLMPSEVRGDGEDRETVIAGYGGDLHSCFRVSEDGEYTSAQDDPFALPDGAHYKIGLPHALELPAEAAAGFGQLLADYELLQPFAQLGRDTYALSAEEAASTKLARWKDLKVPTGKVLGLVNIGWRRGPAQDGGCIWTFDKPANAGRALELNLDPGIIVGMIDEYPEQTLGEITLGHAARWGGNENLTSFDALDAIVASELIRDMERLRP
jgi:predicted DNA-binding WGR domain protein